MALEVLEECGMILEFRSQSFLTGRPTLCVGPLAAVDLTLGAFASRRGREAGKGNVNIPLARQPLVSELVHTPAPQSTITVPGSDVRAVKDCEVSIQWVNLFKTACV
jgi:hypothetical protein